jgi:hypothetical protein
MQLFINSSKEFARNAVHPDPVLSETYLYFGSIRCTIEQGNDGRSGSGLDLAEEKTI